MLQTRAEDFRVDGFEDIKVDVEVNLTDGASTTAYESFINVQYDRRMVNWPVIKVYFWKSQADCSGLQRVNFSGVEFGIRN